jgi:hypothetical protein
MARGLSVRLPAHRRRGALTGIVVAVLAAHLLATHRLADRLATLDAPTRTPPRMAVAYVREMKPTAPVIAAVAPAPPAAIAPQRRPAPAKKRPTAAASAASAVAAEAATAAAAAAAAASAAASSAITDAQSAPDALSAANTADAAMPAEAAASSSPIASSGSETSATSTPNDPGNPTDPIAPTDSSRTTDAATAQAATAASAPIAGATDVTPAFAAGAASAGMTASTPASATGSASSAIAAATPASQASATAKPFEWPASTRLSYDLTGNYRGPVNGTAQVEWVREGSHYQVHLDVVVGATFAPLFTRTMSSDGQITAKGLAPTRYDEQTKLAFQERRVNSVRFDRDGVLLANGRRVDRWNGVQDSASQFVQLSWLFNTRPDLLQPGRSIEVPLALPRRMDRWIYDVAPIETLYTPFGALEAVHLAPRVLPPTPEEAAAASAHAAPTWSGMVNTMSAPSTLRAEVWFAPSLAYLPVRILIHQSEDIYIDLMISRLPQLAAQSPVK